MNFSVLVKLLFFIFLFWNRVQTLSTRHKSTQNSNPSSESKSTSDSYINKFYFSFSNFLINSSSLLGHSGVWSHRAWLSPNRVPTVLRPSLSPTFLQAGSPRKPQRKVARRRRGKLCSFRWFWVGKSHFSFTQNVWKLKIFLAPTGLSTERWTLRWVFRPLHGEVDT